MRASSSRTCGPGDALNMPGRYIMHARCLALHLLQNIAGSGSGILCLQTPGHLAGRRSNALILQYKLDGMREKLICHPIARNHFGYT